ncbi:MAG: hypothetical protein JRN17_01650 [Nitrososphaerota archaeon]|nr:hypothetical protein [Nitrososphaerota archaeon]
MVEEGGQKGIKVKVDGEEAILHITDQSVMFEKGGKVSGFERSAIRMVKPDGDAMIIAYSAGNEVKSVRIEPMTAVASLMVPASAVAQGVSQVGLDAVFEQLYRDTRRELEERLVKVEAEPENKDLRLASEERQKYIAIRNQMTNLVGAKYGVTPDGDEPLLTFWSLENRPYDLQMAVVKITHVDFLLGIVSPRAETEDVGYNAFQVWPQDWPQILKRFNLGEAAYTTESFKSYISYLKSHWTYSPAAKRPVLASS